MKRRPLLFAIVMALPASTIGGQRPLTVSLAGGGSVPMGRFEEAANIGWHALGSVGISTLMQPIGLRLDAAHNRFSAKSIGPNPAVTSVTLNLTYRLPMTNSPLSPYLITGAGGYRFECTGGTSCGTDTRFGWNAGLGTKLAALGAKWFVESRVHAANARTRNVRFVPLTLGLTF